jgi:Penicillin amidase
MRPFLYGVLLLLGGCMFAPAGVEGARVEIRYTDFGVAHIKADGFLGAGYGYGLAAARDNLCAIEERTITIAAERSRYLTADAGYNDAFAGGMISNIDRMPRICTCFLRKLSRIPEQQHHLKCRTSSAAMPKGSISMSPGRGRQVKSADNRHGSVR